eukprot:GHVN01050389.1.p1 GENE.GHVN01050389.1~~GHVN01050389.1.p1  ORF type:complete len:584 (+),score=58.26 GHVN01050389.1:254-2005(+)
MSGSQASSSAPTPEKIREKLEKVLANKHTFLKSTKASFKQFDDDKSGTLNFKETRKLIGRLCQNLQLPPVEDYVLKNIFAKYDKDGQEQLTLEQFAQMYWALLLRIRDKYYPSKKMRVRRDFFIGRRTLGPNRDITSLFKFVKKLGAGSFGEVHLVTERTSGLGRVCKIINKELTQVPVEQIDEEIEVLKNLDHPNIIKIFEVYEDYNNMYIIMETCEGGELLGRIVQAQQRGKFLNEQHVAILMDQLLKALTYIHSCRVIHKDLKPENVLFQDTRLDSPIKVIDFGLAEMFKTSELEHSRNSAGTALYMAPEVFMRDFDFKCDVWSAGCIMYFLLTGQLPFNGATIEEVQRAVLYTEPTYTRDCRHLSSAAVDLLKQMLTKNPILRPTAKQVLGHKWFEQSHKITTELPQNICDNMKAYMKQSNLHNALVNMMAHQLNFTGSQVRQINDTFRALDEDNSGTLSAKELTDGLAKAGVPKWDINRIIQALDVDDSGQVTYTEFLAACYSWQESELNIIWTAFNKMDVDGDGKITVDEFIAVLTGGAENPNRLIEKKDMHAMVKQIDKNNDGTIEWDEFLEYIRP